MDKLSIVYGSRGCGRIKTAFQSGYKKGVYDLIESVDTYLYTYVDKYEIPAVQICLEIPAVQLCLEKAAEHLFDILDKEA